MTKKFIKVRMNIEGLHHWPDCNTPQVSYLAHLHRHTFQIECKLEVTHGNRDIEFIELKHKIETHILNKWYDSTYDCCNFKAMSCEDIAEAILIRFNLLECSVSEDGEFWGITVKE